MINKHYIITRFALQYSEKRFKLKENWVNKRIKIFQKWCYNSINNQTCDNFEWFLFSHKHCVTNKQIEKIKSLKSKKIKHIFLEKGELFIDKSKELIEKENKKNNGIKIITTRLDSDDCVSSNFIETIQEISNFIENCSQDYIINFPLGYLYDIKNKNISMKNTSQPNMFTTLVSEYKNDFTVIQGDHTKLRRYFPVLYLYKKTPMFFQTINKTNILTKNLIGRKENINKFLEDKNFKYMWDLVK